MGIRERVISACRELTCLRGFYRLSIDELARRAGVSKRTVYRYFRSKEEIIEATLDAFMAEVYSEVECIVAHERDPGSIVMEIFKYVFGHGQFIVSPAGLHDLRRHYPHLWQKIDKFRTEKARDLLKVLMARSKKNNTDIDSRIVTAVIIASVQTVLSPDFILENGLTFEEAATQLSRLLLSCFI